MNLTLMPDQSQFIIWLYWIRTNNWCLQSSKSPWKPETAPKMIVPADCWQPIIFLPGLSSDSSLKMSSCFSQGAKLGQPEGRMIQITGQSGLPPGYLSHPVYSELCQVEPLKLLFPRVLLMGALLQGCQVTLWHSIVMSFIDPHSSPSDH